MDISSAARRLPTSPTLAMNEMIAAMRQSGKQVLHLGFGESPFPVHPLIRRALCDNAWRQSYLPTQGILPLRERVCQFYEKMFNAHYSPEQTVVGPGSKPLMYAALAALHGSLFLPAPSWVSYQHLARFLGKRVHHIPTTPEDSYRLTPDSLEAALRKHTPNLREQKILVVNYPCNPTGHSFSESQLKNIAAVAREHNVIVLSDEIYALTSFHDQEHHSMSEFYPEGTLATGGLSKDRSLGGYRFGVLLLPEEEQGLLKAVLAVASEVWSSVPAPIQYAALEAYRTDTEVVEYIRTCTSIHETVTRYAHRQIEEAGVRCPSPQGAFYLFPDWNKYSRTLRKMHVANSRTLSEHLLATYGLATLPGVEFGMPQRNLCVRMATVDYDGEAAVKRYSADPSEAKSNPAQFVESVAPHVAEACSRLADFAAVLGEGATS